MAVAVGECPSGSRSRRGGPAGRTRSRRPPAPARTRPPPGGARCTSAACRSGCPRRGCAPPASDVPPGPARAPPAWRSRRPCPARPAPAGRAGSRSRRPGAPPAAGQRANRRHGVQGGGQQGVVAAVGRRRHRRQPDPARLGGDRAFQPLLAAIHRARPGNLAAAGRLDAAVHRQVRQLQPEQPVVGAKHHQPQPLGEPQGDPLVTAAAQGRRRAGGVGDAAVAAADHQDLDELVEHQPVRDPWAVTAQRVVDLAGGQQGGDLDPQGFEDRRWQGRHETSR
jgi:hypothetical protein